MDKPITIEKHEAKDIQRDPRVYIVNATGHNYSNADKFGTQVILTGGFVDLSFHKTLIDSFKNKMDSIEEFDYLLIAGPLLLNILAFEVWFAYLDKCNVLQWSEDDGEYKVIEVYESDFN